MKRGTLLLAGAVLAGAAAAESPPSLLELDLVELMQIQVTAQRRVEDPQQVPMAITVLPGPRIDMIAAAGDDLRLLSARLPSLQVESSFGRSFPRFYVRGLGNTDFDLNASQPVSLVYDDVVQENPILKGFPLFDLEQLEMARGPQGTLFGRNAPAGVVKFESVRPDAEPDGHVRLGGGRFGTANLETALGGEIGAGWSARIALLQQRRDDWVANLRDVDGSGLEGYRDNAAKLQLLYAGRDGFEALLKLHGRALDGSSRVFRANIIAPGSNRLVDDFRRDRVAHDGRNAQRLDHGGGSLRLRWDFPSVSLHAITGYEAVELFSRGDIDGGFGASYFLPMGPGVIPFDAESAAAIPQHRQLTQELRLESRGGEHWDWQGGLYYFDECLVVEDISYSSTFGAGAQNGYARQAQDNLAWAVFASAGRRVGERLRLQAGLRYTHDRKDFVAERRQSPLAGFGAADQLGPLPASASDAHLSWDLSGIWQFGERLHAYARIAEGFRAPSIQGRLLFNDGLSLARSETVISAEAGLKGESARRRMRYGLAVYRYLLQDQQLTAVGGGANFNTLINADRVHGHGVELDLEAMLGERLRLSVGASHNRTRIDDPGLTVQVCGAPCTVLDPTRVVGGATLALIDGNPLPYAPRWIANLGLHYGMPIATGEFYVFADWAWRSEVNFLLYRSLEFRGRPYSELGLRTGYRWGGGRHELAVFTRNLADTAALVGVIDFNNLAGTVNEPRIWGVEYRVGL